MAIKPGLKFFAVEAKERLTYLSTHGETPHASSLKKPFPAPEAIGDLHAQVVSLYGE